MDEHTDRSTCGSICLVTAELAYLHKNGGIGTSTWLLAHALAGAGFRVHRLYTGQVPNGDTSRHTRQRLHAAGIGLTVLDEVPVPPCLARYPHASSHVWRSEQIDFALSRLHAAHRFDLVEFPELAGLGFRAVQAKRAGLAYQDVGLVVKLHGSNQWCRDASRRWLHNTTELLLDHVERYSFDHADIQLSPCRYMLDYATGIDWRVRCDARVVPYVYPQTLGLPPASGNQQAPRVVFFGRLETRKGLEIFIAAAQRLDPAIEVVFLGRGLELTGGGDALAYLRAQMKGRTYRLLTDLDQEQAVRYLLDRPCLAVMPSLVDNSPNTVIECVVNCIPFLAANTGGIPEIVSDPGLRQRILFEPTAEDLHRCLTDYLSLPATERQEIQDQVGRLVDVAAHNRQVVAEYRELVERWRWQHPRTDDVPPARKTPPLVTVAVTCTVPDHTLADTLQSLDEQTHGQLEVLVIDRAAGAKPLHQALQQARGEFFLPLAGGDLARPRMIELLVRVLQDREDLAAVSCYYHVFAEPTDIAADRFQVARRPTGGSRLLGCLENVFGEACVLYRTGSLRAVGGYGDDSEGDYPEWELFIKLLHHGHGSDVVPDFLCYCRVRPETAQLTDVCRQHARMVARYVSRWNLSEQEAAVLWSALAGSHLTFRNQDSQLGRLTRLRKRLCELPALVTQGVPRLTRHLLARIWRLATFQKPGEHNRASARQRVRQGPATSPSRVARARV
jgi:O-antigen biosynthesis protein